MALTKYGHGKIKKVLKDKEASEMIEKMKREKEEQKDDSTKDDEKDNDGSIS